jgi:hypothetical protein
MTRPTLAVALVIIVALAAASAAAARSFSRLVLSDGHLGSSRSELVAQRDYSTSVVRRLSGSWRVAPRHSTCWSRVPWSRVCDRARRELLAQRWLAGLADRRLRARFPEMFAPAVPAWLAAAFACIHRYEGSWTARTGNGYYGGLQMDLGFQATYGADFAARWGTADRWPVWAQVAAAVRAYESGRGFGPWPRTSVVCGLA